MNKKMVFSCLVISMVALFSIIYPTDAADDKRSPHDERLVLLEKAIELVGGDESKFKKFLKEFTFEDSDKHSVLILLVLSGSKKSLKYLLKVYDEFRVPTQQSVYDISMGKALFLALLDGSPDHCECICEIIHSMRTDEALFLQSYEIRSKLNLAMCAAALGHVMPLMCMIKKKESLLFSIDTEGHTVLMFAAGGKHLVGEFGVKSEALSKYGADLSGNLDCIRGILEIASEKLGRSQMPAYINKTDINGSTALMQAAWYKNTACVKLLLDSGADPHLRSLSGKFQDDDRSKETLLLVVGSDVFGALSALNVYLGEDEPSILSHISPDKRAQYFDSLINARLFLRRVQDWLGSLRAAWCGTVARGVLRRMAAARPSAKPGQGAKRGRTGQRGPTGN